MKLLAIESSALVASVALLDGEQVIAEYSVDYKKTHSQTLLPMIDEIVRMTETDLASIDAIAVSGGPGSFTGLRIGGTTAKGLGLALDKPLIHVPTVDAMAYNFPCADCFICPIMDARRNQVYTGLYFFEGVEAQTILSQTAMPIEELLDFVQGKCSDAGKRVIFLGDGVPVFKDNIVSKLGAVAAFAPANLNRQKASSVAVLGAKLFDEGKIMHADDFVPDYLRQSQAEREYTDVYELTKDSVDFENEVAFILNLEKETFSNPWTNSGLEGHLKYSHNGVLLAKHKGELCGYILYQKVVGEGELLRIAVSPKYRRAGIGRRLIGQLLDDASIDLWCLEVRASNAPAISLYEKMGFEGKRYRQDYYTEPTEDALLMEKLIRVSD